MPTHLGAEAFNLRFPTMLMMGRFVWQIRSKADLFFSHIRAAWFPDKTVSIIHHAYDVQWFSFF